jgi:hypothetical protein
MVLDVQEFRTYEAKGRTTEKFWRDLSFPFVPQKGQFLIITGPDGVKQASLVVIPADHSSGPMELVIRTMGTELEFRENFGFKATKRNEVG